MHSQSLIDIDGSYGEGGGQVLRTALTLSALTGQPMRIDHIRAGRRNPGLAPQHLTALLATARVCNAAVQGAAVGATTITFEPRERPRPGEYQIDVAETAQQGSAGSVTLILQTLLLPLAFAEATSHLTLRGGTHVAWSPPFDYLKQVYLPTLARSGFRADCHLDAWGFYPVGNGQISATIEPVRQPLTPLTLEARGELQQVHGHAIACNLPADIAQRIANRASNVLTGAGIPTRLTPSREKGAGPGAGLFLMSTYDQTVAGFSALGAKGKPSDKVADEACQELLAYHAAMAPVDSHLADQLLLPLALIAGRSQFRTSQISLHLLTNAQIIQRFVPARISIEGAEGQPGQITVEGAPLPA